MREKYSYAVYDDFRQSLLAEIRREAFGEDIGQFSWTTAGEFRQFLDRLDLSPSSILLDVACGSGGLSLDAAERSGCSVVGLDLSEEAVATATKTTRERGFGDRVRFFRHDASEPLPLEDDSVDAIVCVDAINHVFDRQGLFAEWRRVLRPGGVFLFTDAVVVADRLRRTEILARSSGMGDFVFTPLGINERLIEAAGFKDVWCDDVTATIAQTAKKWHDAREGRREPLLKIESTDQYEAMQRMLIAASTLARERRLLRLAFSARKP